MGDYGAFFSEFATTTGELRIYLSPAIDADKVGDGAVVGTFGFWRKETARQFPHSPMVLYAFTAFALVRARLVGTGALCQVFLDFAFHISPPTRCT